MGSPFLFWGPHFPDANSGTTGVRFWGPHFPDPGSPYEPQTPPAPAFALILLLEDGVTVTYSWLTDVFKSRSGLEKRACLMDDPKVTYQGSVTLRRQSVREIRAMIAQYAALGAPFGLALPFEEAAITATSTNDVLNVNTSALDWAVAGQRIAIVKFDGEDSLEMVIQETGSTWIRVDGPVGAYGQKGHTVMPVVSLYLDPAQPFDRYPTPEAIESWQVSGRTALFGYPHGAIRASLAADEPLTFSGAFSSMRFRARLAGSAGNAITVAMNDNSLSGVDVSDDGISEVVISWDATGTTMADLVAAVNATSTLVELVGEYNPSAPLVSVEDEFPATNLTGGLDPTPGTMGVGATIAAFNDHPVWDRYLNVDQLGTDTIQAMTQLLDFDGAVTNVGFAKQPDWGRHVGHTGDLGSEWQWMKGFLDTVKGQWKSWWLPTWRNDLVFVETLTGPTRIVIDDEGDFFTWYSSKRSAIQIVQDDGTVSWHNITGATSNPGDETITLSIDGDAPASLVSMISWMELCRFEGDDIQVSFADGNFTMRGNARVVVR